MEAVAALGVAANVVQFLDFSQKLCSTSLEIYQATKGASRANTESETLLRCFIESINMVSSDLKKYRSALNVTPPHVFGAGAIKDIVDDCRNLAGDLLGRFEKLRAGGNPGRWKSFVRGVKCMWSEKELQDLQSRLGRYQSLLEWRVLISLRESVDLLASRQRDQFADLQTAMTATLTKAIREQVSRLPRWPAAVDETLQQLRAAPLAHTPGQQEQARDQSHDLVKPLKSALDVPRISSGLSHELEQGLFINCYARDYAAKLAAMEARVWQSLSFPVITDREDEIAPVELATFDWIFQPPPSEERPWSSFLEWLGSGESLYWISGKAGSGKSTLMKHLLNHTRTRELLRAWAGDCPLVVASFFFWYSGSDLQKSQIGLLRSLLYQCLTDYRELIPIVLAETARIEITELLRYWTLTRLKSAFIRLLEQKSIPLKICLFMDGLDEYEGDHFEIAELFKLVAGVEQVKVCVSSRPLLVFDRALKSFSGLILQHLTHDDIRKYVRNRLSINKRMKELEHEEPALRPRLAFEIVSKASGVFLWVKLVVHSLPEGLGNYDRGADLERRLQELPEDLEDLY